MNNTISNKNANCYYKSAIKLSLPAQAIPQIQGFEIVFGKKHYLFSRTLTPFNADISAELSRNKYCMNKLLESAGLPVPKSTAVHLNDFKAGRLEEKIAGLSFPLVIKPLLGRLGQNVLCNIKTFKQLEKHMDSYFLTEKEDFLFIEEFHGNLNSYRVLLFQKKVLGVILRRPASVVGDGQHTIQELIDLTNRKRLKTCDTLAPILVDDECLLRLEENKLTLNSILKKDESILLSYTSNASRGGSYESIDVKVCNKNKWLLVRAAKVLNLNLVGFDVQCKDMNEPMELSRGVIIEANESPSIRIHEYPPSGKPNHVTEKIMRSLIYRHPVSYFYSLFKSGIKSYLP